MARLQVQHHLLDVSARWPGARGRRGFHRPESALASSITPLREGPAQGGDLTLSTDIAKPIATRTSACSWSGRHRCSGSRPTTGAAGSCPRTVWGPTARTRRRPPPAGASAATTGCLRRPANNSSRSAGPPCPPRPPPPEPTAHQCSTVRSHPHYWSKALGEWCSLPS